jgi:hypothetical protein
MLFVYIGRNLSYQNGWVLNYQLLLVHSTILTISASTGKIIVHVAVLLVTSVAKETKVQIMNIIIHTGIFSNIDN